MAFDPEREFAKIEEMKQDLRAHFDRSVLNNKNTSALAQRDSAAKSAQAYASLVKVQVELVQMIGRPKLKPVL